ncbi:MAG TPA: UDP-glucose 4-epimerase GalE [Candidatus Limnocylindrales bacterium]|nr:UDP-glucose 4-epimerase GalE [Candidatus Limnocylindrales bacterium]
MRVLVTGGAGYVGSVSVEALLAAGHEVVVLDDLSTGHRGALPSAVAAVEGSVTGAVLLREILERQRSEAVLHCAARSLVGESLADPAGYYRDNVGGGLTLLEAMRATGVRRLVFSSSAAVYGEPASAPVTEDAPLQPISPYGETKRAFEAMLEWYGRAYGLRSISLRYFNAAGASASNGEDHDPETHLIPNVVAAALGMRELVLFGDDYPTPDGTPIRDYIHVADLADAHLLALEATASGTGAEAYNLGSGRGFSVREVLTVAEAIAGRPIAHRIGPRRPGDPPVLVASAERAASVLGWRARRGSLEEIVGSAWAWAQRHPAGYED